MASAKQIAANRVNSTHSTGPRTDIGKFIASQNATTHGLTGQTICRQPGQDDAYNAFYQSMLPDFAPATALELDFVNRIIHDSWRLNRAGAMDDNLLDDSIDANHFDYADHDKSRAIAEARAFRAEARTINLLSLYEQRLQRALLKNLAALKTMQKERQSAAQSTPKPVPAVRKPAPQPVETPAAPLQNGFVCATPPNQSPQPPLTFENAPSNMAA